MSSTHREPGPDHPITVEPSPAHVTVRVGDTVIADSTRTLALQEASYPVVHYVPLDDVDQELLTPTDTVTHCPYKGDASYWTVRADDTTVDDALWGYQHPYPAVAAIAGHVAFYPDRVQITVA
ncbi:uncharacterized protein (DUF427 family) [Friedmanniella endophytica]|uniref:Uncharacterized protein (DUF427 family) n=1 Tax=Microlunatus kandeliicorticis TaxID=1759536 RepID=A0A7W3IST4_9ACTN|nr:DUF427 domain-containing protein [Microlunatus kandeliicorticis]MBA8794515.1 uncharacterized protein (DUF427 family) [Microlunatus kandeliicorticis]